MIANIPLLFGLVIAALLVIVLAFSLYSGAFILVPMHLLVDRHRDRFFRSIASDYGGVCDIVRKRMALSAVLSDWTVLRQATIKVQGVSWTVVDMVTSPPFMPISYWEYKFFGGRPLSGRFGAGSATVMRGTWLYRDNDLKTKIPVVVSDMLNSEIANVASEKDIRASFDSLGHTGKPASIHAPDNFWQFIVFFILPLAIFIAYLAYQTFTTK